MSRCFPYPPPGYERSPTHDVALIESIKLQREVEKAKKERRKEKKQEKKEKEKARKNGEVEDKKRSHKSRHKDGRSQEDKKGDDHRKRRESETEKVEKSNLTEENGNPVASRNLCNSTDSTLNSSKKQKHSSPADDRQNPGSIIRIRLPLQRHKDPEVLPPRLEQPCSSRRTDGYVEEKWEAATLPGFHGRGHPCSTSTTQQEIAIELGNEKPCFTSRASKTTGNKAETAPAPRLHGGGSHPLELQFKKLLENWAPPPLQLQHTDFNDQSWLLETKQNHKRGAEGSSIAISNCLSGANSTPWPRSHYLPEADIYALPFTIPF